MTPHSQQHNITKSNLIKIYQMIDLLILIYEPINVHLQNALKSGQREYCSQNGNSWMVLTQCDIIFV